MRAFLIWLTALTALLLGVAAPAQLPQPGRNAMRVTLVPETRAVPAGETATLALVMKPDEGWHGYWQNPGDAGVETRIDWQLPAGVTAGPLQYPVPDRLLISGLMNYVFKGDYAHLIDIAIPAGLLPTLLP